jgi:hypothetical protein
MEIKELNNNIKFLAKVSNSNDSFKCEKAYAYFVIKELNTEIKQEVLKLSKMYDIISDSNFSLSSSGILYESSETYKKLLQKMYKNRELISKYIDIILNRMPHYQFLVRFINFLDNESYLTEDFMNFVHENRDLLEE